jgi:hypothetical protein
MSLTLNNVKPRKTLASQLDRFDRVLDGLAENLNAAVADSVKESVAVAVKEVLAQFLTHTEVPKRLKEVHDAVAPTRATTAIDGISEAMSRVWKRAKGIAHTGFDLAKAITSSACNRARAFASGCVRYTRTKMHGTLNRVRLAARVSQLLACWVGTVLWRHRKPILLTASGFCVIGLSCFIAGRIGEVLGMGMSCGAVAGATSIWLLPLLKQITIRRRMAEHYKK